MARTLWRRDEQTEGKHLVLRSYLDGWFPILSRWNGRLLFIDGFAGPGEYLDGEPGSPLVALDCVRRHRQAGRLKGIEVVCLFIESDAERAEHLRGVLAQEPSIRDTEVRVLQGEFDDSMSEILDHIEEQNTALAPAFVMIDPFGPKGSPMKLIGRVLANDKSECLISFMYEPIRRFHGQPEHGPSLDALFGTTTWRRCLAITSESERKQFLHGLFAAELKRHGARYVIPLELWKGNRHVYTLYFATGSLKGCDLMKKSIWKVDPSGGFSFRGYAVGQTMLFGTDTEPLADQLRERFAHDWVPVERLDDFVMSDETPYHSGLLRRHTLRRLEAEGRLEVQRPRGGTGFTANRGIRVRFTN